MPDVGESKLMSHEATTETGETNEFEIINSRIFLLNFAQLTHFEV